MEDKNFFVAIALCIGVYMIWFGLVQPRTPPAQSAAQNTSAASQTASAPAAESTQTMTGKLLPSAIASISHKDIPKEFEIKTPDAEIKISPLGAAISSYRYRGPLGFVELVVNPAPGIFSTWPDAVFVLDTNTAALKALKEKAESQASMGPFTRGTVSQPNPSASASAYYQTKLPSGLIIQKAFGFSNTGTLGSLDITIRNPTKNTISVPSWDLKLGPGLGTVQSEQNDNAKLWRAIGLFPPPEGRTKDALEHLKEGSREGPWRWLAVDNRYFLEAALASPQDFERVKMDPVKIQVPYSPSFSDHLFGRAAEIQEVPAPSLNIQSKAITLAPGASKTYNIPFYLGPKTFTDLERMGLGLERSVNFGWFDTVGRGMLKLLQLLHRLTGNYGWSIILLTIMIQLVLFPLTFKSLKSMAKMRKIQPEMARLQQKYKQEPQRLNMEMMELYKAKGVNPMGGCLPMLVQMPIFVALFNALRNAWELHGAPWVFWVHDLSARDPFYILPVVMGGVMFAQNRLNPAATTGDPAQAAMMKWMPMIFVVMFFKFPAGLVLYWLTNSLLSTMQQLALRNQLNA